MGMKFNWGKGIVLAFLLFIGFILSFVFRMIFDDAYNNEMVSPEYYKEELEYQSKIDKIKAYKMLQDTVRYNYRKEGLILYFPKDIENQEVLGSISFYRPSSIKKDSTIQFQTATNTYFLPNLSLQHGRWNLNIDFSANDNAYLAKHKLWVE